MLYNDESYWGGSHLPYRRHPAHGVAHGFVAGVDVEMGGGRDVGVAQRAGNGRHVHAVLDGAGRKRVVLLEPMCS